MLLRNMFAHGLTIGTRVVVKQVLTHLLKCKVATGQNAGETVYMPRITLQSSDESLPFEMKKRQFLGLPCFAMTINKAQGQTLQHVYGYLPRSCFSHGQTYDMISRVGAASRVHLFVAGREGDHAVTENVVFKEVLTI